MKYIIFGAGGFLGNNLAKYLLHQKEEVIKVFRKASEYSVDIRRTSSFQKLKKIKEADIIINCASVLPDALSANKNSYLKNLFDTNVIGAANILRFAASHNIQRIINCSTLVVTNKPWPVSLKETDMSYPTGIHTGYAVSKLSQELLMNEIAKQYGIELLHMRLSSLYGVEMKWNGILPLLIEKAIKSEKIHLTNALKVSFDFLLIDDLVKIIQLLANLPVWSYDTINVASSEEIFLKELAEKSVQLTNSSSLITYTDTESPASRSAINIERLKKMIGDYSFTPLDKGIVAIISNYKAQE